MRTWTDTALGPVIATVMAVFGFSAPALGSEVPTVRVAVLQFGTVNWEVDVMEHHGFDAEAGIRLDVRLVSSTNATAVALQSGSADVIVSDWIWVSRQRAGGRPWTFVPWSTAVGSVLVRPGAGIESLDDLAGRRIGVAGGPVDKSWLLLQALYRARYDQDLGDVARPVFGAPPLLNRLMLRGDLDAVINYWHYGARLQAAGMTPLIDIPTVLAELGIEQFVPLLGWVFSEEWAQENPEAVNGLLRASSAAKRLLATSDAEWNRLAPVTMAENDATLHALRDAFQEGIPQLFGESEIAAAHAVYSMLAKEGGETLTGGYAELAPGTFWQPREDMFTQWQQ